MKHMENRNMTEFVLLGLTENPKMQKIVFAMFLVDLHDPGIKPESLTSLAFSGQFFATSDTWEVLD